MKTFLVSALAVLFCGVLSAAETDMYLYWMIDPDATVDGEAGVDLSSYNARISTADGALMFYDSRESTSGYMSKDVGYVQGWSVVSRVGDLQNASFFIEIFNNDGIAFESETMSYTDLVAAGAIGTMSPFSPVSTYGFSTFRTVPEPTSGLLLLIGVAGLALRRQKMKKA